VSEGTECSFRATGQVELWDPWTGTTRPLRVRSQASDITRLRMPLTDKELQLIVFSPGNAAMEPADAPAPSAASVVPLDGSWEFELKPTMDNRFGDFRWPPTPTMIGAEARQFRYADETTPNPGWQNSSFDDSKWPKVTASFGPKFWKLGPLPDPADTPALEAQLANLKQVDPNVPVEVGGKKYLWQPYSFSWRWGIENDPGHQGYHGLKEDVHDEFIGLGKRQTNGTGTGYEKEEAGSRYYLWTSVNAGSNLQARAIVGGLNPAAAWLNQKPLSRLPAPVGLNEGVNPVLLRYDNSGRGFFVIDTSASAEQIPMQAGTMAMSWFNKPGLLPFDTRPQTARPAGWYRFTSPPGLRAMTIIARGRVQAWADGREMSLTAGKSRDDGAYEFIAAVSKPAAAAVVVALRIEQDRGTYAGAALPEPMVLDCAVGQTPLGDWTQQGVLECYSGGAWYRRTFSLTPDRTRGRVTLDLANLSSSAEVRINGQTAGIRIAPPWKFDITPLVKPGDNRVEVLVLSALGGHYTTIPTRYRGSRVSGLLGPVQVQTRRPSNPKD